MLASRLRKWFAHGGFASQEEAAVALGVSRPLLNQLMLGRRRTCSRANAERISDGTGIPLRLFGFVALDEPNGKKKRVAG